VEVFLVTNDNIEHYVEMVGGMDFYDQLGVTRYLLAQKLMEKLGIKKMMILGVDTITCARLDEFLDDNTDILATLNYPCQESTAYWKTPIIEFMSDHGKILEHMNLNADVICFNNANALKRVVELSIEHFSGFGEQGGLNDVAHAEKSYNVKVVDFPYHLTTVVYNARSKGVYGTGMNNENTPQMKFYVKDGKLFTYDNKQIKVWHYIEGLAGQNEFEFKALIDNWKFKWFNAETKAFFKEHCECRDFFEKPYDIKNDWYGI
jgi:hypothetical protein